MVTVALAACAAAVVVVSAATEALYWEYDDEDEDGRPRRKRRRTYHRDRDYWASTWGAQVLTCRAARAAGQPDFAVEEEFRQRFRLPFDLFEELVVRLREKGGYEAAQDPIGGVGRVPLELKFMTVLRIAGRGWCFDDVKEQFGAGKSTIAAFYHAFVFKYVTDFYDQVIVLPEEAGDLAIVESRYAAQGVPGCVGSIDCVHVRWDRCPFALRWYHVGKEGFPTRVYEVVVDNTRRIRAVTPGFPGARNDKTIVRNDRAVYRIRTETKYTQGGAGLHPNCAASVLTGLYFICDGGYHMWSQLMCPFKYATEPSEKKWSKRIEALRKDVERTFGALKARWRCLKCPCMFFTAARIDNQFMFCCIVSTQIDQLTRKTDQRYQAEMAWLGRERDTFDPADLGRWFGRRQIEYDSSRVGTGVHDNDIEAEEDTGFHEKRALLVDHFKHMSADGSVVWLRS